MSNTGKFKSSKEAAQVNAGAIAGAVAGGLEPVSLHFHMTNLSVISNIEEMKTQLSLCNADFQRLVVDDSDNILKLSEFFTDFDTDIAAYMTGEINGY